MIKDANDDCIRLARLVDDYGWDHVKSLAPESVQYMIRLGQSARRHVHPEVWLDALWHDETFEPEDGLTVISDVRQPNEVEFIRDYDGQMWLVTRPGTVDQGMDSLLKDIEFDAHLVNDGTLDDLDRIVDTIMAEESL